MGLFTLNVFSLVSHAAKTKSCERYKYYSETGSKKTIKRVSGISLFAFSKNLIRKFYLSSVPTIMLFSRVASFVACSLALGGAALAKPATFAKRADLTAVQNVITDLQSSANVIVPQIRKYILLTFLFPPLPSPKKNWLDRGGRGGMDCSTMC